MTGFFTIGIWHPKTELNVGTLWRTAYSLGASSIFTVGRRYRSQASDTVKAWAHIPLMHFSDVHSLIAHLPFSTPLVGVELHPTAKPVSEFAHPRRACYLLGAEDHGLTPEIVNACHYLIQLPGSICHNVAVAGSMVMYDRISKGLRNERSRAFHCA